MPSFLLSAAAAARRCRRQDNLLRQIQSIVQSLVFLDIQECADYGIRIGCSVRLDDAAAAATAG